MQKQTTLPGAVALECPPWAAPSTKQLAAETAEQFDTTKRARQEAERLQEAVGDVDILTTDVAD